MPLSNEDALRLNVLSTQNVRAIRINESDMVLHALTDRGEARIELNPNSRHEAYLREIRGFLSEKYLGMPGGYPRHLKRWTRMGMGHNSMDKMLLLGDPEAVVALAYARHHISAEIAGDAWWACQSPEIARNLLKSRAVVDSPLGPELAQFLLEFLPFEPKPLDIVDSVKQCLQGELISPQSKASLWIRAKRKQPYFVGFLFADPASIPLDESAHQHYEQVRDRLQNEVSADNPFACILLRFMAAEGRKWLRSLELALEKPTEPDVVIALFIAIDSFIDINVGEENGTRSIQHALELADSLCNEGNGPLQLQAVKDMLTHEHIPLLRSVLVLAQLGENTLIDYFSGRDATGTVMRKHMKPLTTSVYTTIETLLT